MWKLARDWPLIRESLSGASPLAWLGGLAVGLPYLLAPVVWWLILRDLGARPRFWRTYRVWATTNLGKYLPGKVWQIIGRIYLPEGDRVLLAESVALDTAANMVAAGWIGGLAWLWKREPAWAGPPLLVWALAGLALVAWPGLLGSLLRWAMRLFKGEELPETGSLSPAKFLKYVGLYSVFWALQGLGLFWALLGFGYRSSPLVLTGIYALAWAAGYISLLAPAGVGVREGTFVALLSGGVPGGIAGVLALWARLFTSGTELAMGLICSAGRPQGRAPHPEENPSQ